MGYHRHFSYREPGTLKEELGHSANAAGDLFALTFLFLGIFSIPLIIGAIAQAAKSAPIVRSGEFCPIGYYRASAYCMPLKATTPTALPRTTENCPIGTYTQSDYCINAQ